MLISLLRLRLLDIQTENALWMIRPLTHSDGQKLTKKLLTI